MLVLCTHLDLVVQCYGAEQRIAMREEVQLISREVTSVRVIVAAHQIAFGSDCPGVGTCAPTRTTDEASATSRVLTKRGAMISKLV